MENKSYPNIRTKIVCTIGPSSWDEEVMHQMIEAGMDVARINGAFADRAELLKVEELVRKFSSDVSMMVDIKGPEVRMNKFEEPVKLEPGMEIEFGSSKEFPIYPANYPDTYKKMQVGQRIKIGDGDVELEVTEVREKSFMAKVNYGSELKPGKAMNFPGLVLNDNPLTEKDKDLLTYAMERNWEFVSASFIRTKKDAEIVKEFIGDSKIEIIAKIEDEDGVKNIDDILEVVDGIMVARGGLGVAMGLEKVPMAQRTIIAASIKAAKPTITATQMLDSMERNPLPTRAEANDVATAILLGSDSIMLSGESTAGKHPVEAVRFMSTMDAGLSETLQPQLVEESAVFLDKKAVAFSKAIFSIATTLEDEIKAIVIATDNLINVSLVARHNLKQPVIVVMNDEVRRRQSLLRKGVQSAIKLDDGVVFHDRDQAIEMIRQKLFETGAFQPGEKYLLVVDLFEHKADFPKVFEIVTAQ